MLRSVLHIDPTTLTDEEWIYQVLHARWMLDYQMSRLAQLMGLRS